MRGALEAHPRRTVRLLAERVALAVDGYRAEVVPAGSVLFLGSSTIARFPLAECFPGAPVLARGIPDEPTWSLLRRLEASLPVAPPAGVVLYAGGPDAHRERASVAVVERRIARLFDELRRLLPDTPAAILAVLPRRDMRPAEVAELRELNAAIRARAAAHGVAFVETHSEPITDSTGSLSAAVSDDALHLSREGYRLLAAAILRDGGSVAPLLAR
jgi:lysophospholipase L1-like esterase